MYSDLLPLVRTKSDVDKVCRELDRLIESLFMLNSGGFDEVLQNGVARGIAEILRNELPQDNESKKEELRKIKEELLKLPVVNLTIAGDLTSEEIEEISDDLRTNVNAGIILDIQRDSLIVGGALITYQGKFGDFSISTKMEKAWDQIGANLTKMAYGSN